MPNLSEFDFAAFFSAFDAKRRDLGLGWYEFADELWQLSSQLNAQRTDHPLCGGAVSRLGTRGETSCQYALFILRWLDRALTWAGLADEIGCTPSRLSNLRTARMADMGLTMRVTQWLHKPAAAFIQPRSVVSTAPRVDQLQSTFRDQHCAFEAPTLTPSATRRASAPI